MLTGTPTEESSRTEYTWTATDADGDTAALTFTITVEPDLSPSFETTVADQEWIEDESVTAVSLPAAVGGNGRLSYKLTPALPSGVTRDPSTQVLTGTPTEESSRMEYTWTATDADGDTAALTFTIVVKPDLMPVFGVTVADQEWIEDESITAVRLPAASGGNGTLSYTLTPALPSGVTRDPATQVLTGTPMEEWSRTEYTWTATDADGDTAALTFAITVERDMRPSFETTVADQEWIEGESITPMRLPAAVGGNGRLSYELNGPAAAPSGDITRAPLPSRLALPSRMPLPSGILYVAPGRPEVCHGQRGDAGNVDMSMAGGGGTLCGTPREATVERLYTLTATDADGDTAALTFTLMVKPDMRPGFEGTVADQEWIEGESITAVRLPAASGGNGTLSYRLTPALPGGVTRDPTTHVLTGTPTEGLARTEYRWTATDADGDTAEVRFSVRVLSEADVQRRRLRAVNAVIVPELSRAMWSSAVESVTGRLGPERREESADVSGSVASVLEKLRGRGQRLEDNVSWDELLGLERGRGKLSEEGSIDWKELLGGTLFTVRLGNEGAGSGLGLWAGSDYRKLSGGRAVEWEGGLFGVHTGVDVEWGSGFVGGVGASRFDGDVDYTDRSGGREVRGEHRSGMTIFHPYLGWSSSGGSQVWGSLGYGQGKVKILDGAAGRERSDTEFRGGALGGSVRVYTGQEGTATVDLKGEGQTTRMRVDDNGELLAGLSVGTHRLRVAVEGKGRLMLESGGSLEPSLELGVRWDGGDGETGAGLELGSRVGYDHPELGLSVEASGRVLLAHEGESREWGVGGSIRLDPGSDGRGLSFEVSPAWGKTDSGMQRLWEDGLTGERNQGEGHGARVDAELGYGLSTFNGVMTPYGGMGLSSGERTYRMGSRFALGPSLTLNLEGERGESSGAPEYGVKLTLDLTW